MHVRTGWDESYSFLQAVFYAEQSQFLERLLQTLCNRAANKEFLSVKDQPFNLKRVLSWTN